MEDDGLKQWAEGDGFNLSSLSLSTSYSQTRANRRSTVVIGGAKAPSPSYPSAQPEPFSWTSLFPELGTDWPSSIASSPSTTASTPRRQEGLTSSSLAAPRSSASQPSSREGSFRSDGETGDEGEVVGVKIETAAGEEDDPSAFLTSAPSAVVAQLAPQPQRPQTDRDAARLRRRRRLQLRKPDSALALGLFEHYFKLEVQVPSGGGAVEKQAFLIPQTYSVDQVKRHVFKYGDGFGDLSPDDFQLGVADDQRFTIEFAVFTKAHPTIVESLKNGEAAVVSLFPSATGGWTGETFRRRSQTLHQIEAETLEKGSRIAMTAQRLGATTVALPVAKKTLSEELIDRAVSGAELQQKQRPVKDGWRKTRPSGFFQEGMEGEMINGSPEALMASYDRNDPPIVICCDGYQTENQPPARTHPRPAGAHWKIYPIDTRQLRLEETIYDACSYNRYFYSQRHVNFGGVHSTEGPVVVSVLKTPVHVGDGEAPLQDDNPSNKTRAQRFRVLVWSKYGEKQALVAWTQRLIVTGRPPGKRLLKALQSTSPNFLGQIDFYRLAPSERVAEELLEMELKQVVSNYKFGILYAKEGQYKETDMFSNERGSEAFEHFLSVLGEKVELQGWTQYRAGLDVRVNATGTHSVYTTWQDYEVMFHVSTYLPYDDNNRQQLERKRHLGNDIVVLIFSDGSTPYLANTIKSEFNHVFVVVQPIKLPNGAVAYRVGNTYKEGVKRFSPYLPDANEYVFEHGPAFREFLLTKLINAERAAYFAPSFAAKIKRTKTMLLEGLLGDFPPQATS